MTGCAYLQQDSADECLRLKLNLNLQFFAKDGPGGEKTEEPTAKKLNDVRKEGQTAKSKELVMAVSLLALFLIVKIYSGGMGKKFIECFSKIYNTFSVIVDSSKDGMPVNLAVGIVSEAVMAVINIVLPVLIIAFVISLLGNSLQQRWMVTSKPLKPEFSKMNPINGVKRLFSTRQLIELLKSIAMMLVMGIVIYTTIADRMDVLLTFYNISLNAALAEILDIIMDMGIKICIIFMVIGFVDLFYQKWKFRQDNMMTKQEVKDEFKNSEGDPQVKGQIRRKMMEASMRRMMQQLPQADVVITNPTHFAVALKYDPNQGKAPVVIAKGADYLAQKIKDVARENSIAIVENKPLARILYNNVDIGTEIPPELYQAVAEILARVLAPETSVV